MTRKRRNFTPELKSKVAIEALTLAELAKKYTLHPNMIRTWKHQAIQNMQSIFSSKKSMQNYDREEEINALHAKIGQLTIDNDFLKRDWGFEPRGTNAHDQAQNTTHEHRSKV